MAVAAEGFELVDEFVDDVPGPERLESNSVSMLDIVEGESSQMVVPD